MATFVDVFILMTFAHKKESMGVAVRGFHPLGCRQSLA